MSEPTPEPAPAPGSTPAPVTVPLDSDMAGWLVAYQRARDKTKHWAATADAAQRHITDLLDAAGATVATVDGRTAVRWTTVESHRVNGAALRADHPELADTYSTTVVQRRFTTPYVPTEGTA